MYENTYVIYYGIGSCQYDFRRYRIFMFFPSSLSIARSRVVIKPKTLARYYYYYYYYATSELLIKQITIEKLINLIYRTLFFYRDCIIIRGVEYCFERTSFTLNARAFY